METELSTHLLVNTVMMEIQPMEMGVIMSAKFKKDFHVLFFLMEKVFAKSYLTVEMPSMNQTMERSVMMAIVKRMMDAPITVN